MRTILCNLLNPVSEQQAEYLPLRLLTLNDGKITAVEAYDPTRHHGFEDRRDCLCLPGFIDLHVHLSQYRMRGLYEPALLPWLNKYVFPEEARSAASDYAYELAEQFFDALAAKGTTMSVIYTAPFPTACQAAFEVAELKQVKALIGMTMMDMHTPPNLLQDSAQALADSIALYERWHLRHPHLDYIFTPRFAPTCSRGLMHETGSYIQAHQAWLQTHLSENSDEIAWVKQLFGMPSYTEVYAEAGLLSSKSILGHAIHLAEEELKLLKETGALIAHCPDSNFYLKSGEFPLAAIERHAIPYGLGSDVGAGTTLNMLHHAKMMNFRQSAVPISPAKALYHITLGSAKLLQMDAETGSLHSGKAADLVILKPPAEYPPSADSLSQLIFFGTEFRVLETLVNGATHYLNPEA